MKPVFEKLIRPEGTSFRCFDRTQIRTPAKWHRHPELEICYVEKGTGTRIVGDNVSPYGNHDLVFIGSNLPHTWQSDQYLGRRFDRHPAIVIQFQEDFLGEQIFEVPEFASIAAMLRRSGLGLWFPPEEAERLGAMMTQMVHLDGPTRIISLLTLLRDMSEAEGTSVLASEGFSPRFDERTESRVQNICQYINQNLRDPELDHLTLAERAQMNPSAFSRFFKRSTGRTVTQYINELRIGLACRLLLDSDESVINICLEAGFNNVSNFNRRFRELRGLTPRDYRKKFASQIALPGDHLYDVV